MLPSWPAHFQPEPGALASGMSNSWKFATDAVCRISSHVQFVCRRLKVNPHQDEIEIFHTTRYVLIVPIGLPPG